MTKREKIKYLLVPAIGFGIGGALLGLGRVILFQRIELGIILFVLLGSFSLVALENIKLYKKTLVVLGLLLIWVIVIPAYILGFLVFVLPDSPPFDSMFLTTLIFSLFFLSGPVIVGLFYALVLSLVLKIRVWPVFWRGAIGFLFILAPLSNLVFANSMTAILGFILVGIISGLFLGWGVYKGQKLKKIGGRKEKKSPEYEKTSI